MSQDLLDIYTNYLINQNKYATVKLNKDNKVKKLYLLATAPELEKLRESYALSSRLKGHDCHITISTQVLGKPQVKVEEVILEECEELEEAA